MRYLWLVAVIASGLAALAQSAAPRPGPWEQPAEALAGQIAGILGPGQARLTIRNLSTISVDEIPAIRRQLEQDLKAHGVAASGAESANTIRVTLSENVRERLWVAEVVQGNETRVAMVRVDPGTPRHEQSGSGLALRKQALMTTKEPALAVLQTGVGLVVVEPEAIVLYADSAEGWREQQKIAIRQKRSLARDPRAVILPVSGADGYQTWLPGLECGGSFAAQKADTPPQPGSCHESDDPWPILQIPAQASAPGTSPAIKAFYNAARNYFTGVVTPSVGVDLPAFYSAALLPRPTGAALLVNGIDGKVQVVDGGVLKPVSGARDWGSDFAALETGCGTGTQVVASGSGEAASDSLRAYELPAQEAVPASAPLAMDGTVTALGAAPDGKSVYAVVRTPAGEYEVDRVTASCN